MALYSCVYEELAKWNHLGSVDTDDGSHFIGPMSDFGPYAYFHKLLPPLTEGDIRELEKQLDLPVPKALRDFYLKSNGGYFYNTVYLINGDPILSFAFSLFGLRKIYREGSAEDLLRQPYDLISQNHMDAFTYKTNTILISKYSADDSRVYLNNSGDVVRIFPGGRIGNMWSSFEDWLLGEIRRLSSFYGENFQLSVAPELTLPPWPSR